MYGGSSRSRSISQFRFQIEPVCQTSNSSRTPYSRDRRRVLDELLARVQLVRVALRERLVVVVGDDRDHVGARLEDVQAVADEHARHAALDQHPGAVAQRRHHRRPVGRVDVQDLRAGGLAALRLGDHLRDGLRVGDVGLEPADVRRRGDDQRRRRRLAPALPLDREASLPCRDVHRSSVVASGGRDALADPGHGGIGSLDERHRAERRSRGRRAGARRSRTRADEVLDAVGDRAPLPLVRVVGRRPATGSASALLPRNSTAGGSAELVDDQAALGAVELEPLAPRDRRREGELAREAAAAGEPPADDARSPRPPRRRRASRSRPTAPRSARRATRRGRRSAGRRRGSRRRPSRRGVPSRGRCATSRSTSLPQISVRTRRGSPIAPVPTSSAARR